VRDPTLSDFLKVFNILFVHNVKFLGWPKVKVLGKPFHDVFPVVLLVLNSVILPIIISCGIYIKLICVKRRLFLNKIGVIQSEGTTTIAQQSNIHFKQKTLDKAHSDYNPQPSPNCSKDKEGTQNKNLVPWSTVYEVQDEDSNRSHPNTLTSLENASNLNNKEQKSNCAIKSETSNSKNQYKTCEPDQTESNHKKSSPATVSMESEDIQVLSVEQINNTSTNSNEMQATSIQTYQNTDVEIGTLSIDNSSRGNLCKRQLVK
jgi:hypothetical protein